MPDTTDQDILEYVREDGRGLPYLRNKATSNLISYDLGLSPGGVLRVLNRLRDQGLVEHVPHGNKGRGYWRTTERGDADV